jgi:diaminopimelate epimerase
MMIEFTKMEGAGNDYIYVDTLRSPFPVERATELARSWSNRNFGIGADGLILLQRGTAAPVRMAMWNADGSRGSMCGNGLRCLARLAKDHGHVAEPMFVVETDAGNRAVTLLADDLVQTDMGPVRCWPPITVTIDDQRLEYIPGDAGNPHAVVFVPAVDQCDVARWGTAMQRRSDLFPDSVNVEFVEVLGATELRQRTFERGSGETLACGTGAAVAALAARQTGRCIGHSILVRLRGGSLRVLLDQSSLAIEGPARTVFTGRIALPT